MTAQRHLDVTTANDEGGGGKASEMPREEGGVMFVAADDIRGRVSVKMPSDVKVCFFGNLEEEKEKKKNTKS